MSTPCTHPGRVLPVPGRAGLLVCATAHDHRTMHTDATGMFSWPIPPVEGCPVCDAGGDCDDTNDAEREWLDASTHPSYWSNTEES